MHGLPHAATPEEAGISSQGILDFIDKAAKQGLEFHSLMVLHKGQVACALNWAPYDLELPHTLFSLTKSFTSAAAGFAVSEGLMRYEDSIADILPDKLTKASDPKLKQVTLHSLLCMGSGLDPLSNRVPRRQEDWAKAALAYPVLHEPGTHFHYNSMGSYLVSAMVQKVTGQTCRDYLMPRLFDKLGIAKPQWDSCPLGVSMGGYGLHLNCEDIAKFGQLLLQDGLWQGERVLPEGWVKRATQAYTDNSGFNNHIEWGLGYGYQFWRTRGDRFRGDGMHGQLCIVDPARELVVACTAGIPDMGAQMDLIHELLIPAADAQPADQATQARLARRIKGLRYRLPRHQPGMPDLTGSYLAKGGRQLQLSLQADQSLILSLHRRGEASPPFSFRLAADRPHRGEVFSHVAGEAAQPYLGQYSWHEGRLVLSVRVLSAPYTLAFTIQPEGDSLLVSSRSVHFESGDFTYLKQQG